MLDIGFITKDILGCYSVKGYGVLSPAPGWRKIQRKRGSI